MLINVDFKALEWICALYLSQDKVGIQEVLDQVDIHSVNQNDIGLPSRLIAKVFLFRIIFEGSAYAFSKDSDFRDVKGSQDFWQKRIDKFFGKYWELRQFMDRTFKTANETGEYLSPTGRRFNFRYVDGVKQLELSKTKIANYPIQSLGHDIVALARIALFRILIENELETKLIATVHDSILLDSPKHEWYNIYLYIKQVFQGLPDLFEQTYGPKFNLPLRGEISYGKNYKEMKEFHED